MPQQQQERGDGGDGGETQPNMKGQTTTTTKTSTVRRKGGSLIKVTSTKKGRRILDIVKVSRRRVTEKNTITNQKTKTSKSFPLVVSSRSRVQMPKAPHAGEVMLLITRRGVNLRTQARAAAPPTGANHPKHCFQIFFSPIADSRTHLKESICALT